MEFGNGISLAEIKTIVKNYEKFQDHVDIIAMNVDRIRKRDPQYKSCVSGCIKEIEFREDIIRVTYEDHPRFGGHEITKIEFPVTYLYSEDYADIETCRVTRDIDRREEAARIAEAVAELKRLDKMKKAEIAEYDNFLKLKEKYEPKA